MFIFEVIGVYLLISLSEFFGNLTAKACINSLPKIENDFFVDNVRVAKLIGGGLHESFIVNGLVVVRLPEIPFTKITRPRVAVYGCPLDT